MPLSTSSTSRGLAHPARSPQIEERLDARQVEYSFEPNFPVERLRDAEGNQVRLSEHRAPKQTVARYAEQMKNGAVFPGIVVNSHGELVDGNTRRAATIQIGRTTIATYVCSDLTPLCARALSVELNQSHGQSMTGEEIRAFVAGAVQEGQRLDITAYARMTGTKPATLKRWIRAQEARTRAARSSVSVERFELVPETVQAALQLSRLHSVFVEAARLAIDAHLTASVTKSIVREANAAASEAEALVVLAAERDARVADISTSGAGFKVQRRRSVGAAPHLAALMKYKASDFTDISPEKVPDTIARMERLHAQLGTALAQLRQSALAPISAAAPRELGDAA